MQSAKQPGRGFHAELHPSAELSLDSAYLYVNVLEGGLLPP